MNNIFQDHKLIKISTRTHYYWAIKFCLHSASTIHYINLTYVIDIISIKYWILPAYKKVCCTKSLLFLINFYLLFYKSIDVWSDWLISSFVRAEAFDDACGIPIVEHKISLPFITIVISKNLYFRVKGGILCYRAKYLSASWDWRSSSSCCCSSTGHTGGCGLCCFLL